MPVEADIRLTDGDHVVQFYEADDDLVSVVMGYLRAAVVEGDSVLVIATPEHRAAFESALRAAGLDVDRALAHGRLAVLDAAETLATFMVGDAPDPATFDAVVGGLVRGLGARGRSLRAYGEMVALLWDAGKVSAAIELERLWNGLAERTAFSLFCAYPAHMVSGAILEDQFAAVCHLHTEVVAGAPAPHGSEVLRRFPRSSTASRQARNFVATTLGEWGLGALIDDAVLVVAELAANAVEHARSDFTVGLSRTGDGVRVEVADGAATVPCPQQPLASDVRGRGLVLIAQLAHRWGHRPVADGKVIWVDLLAGDLTA